MSQRVTIEVTDHVAVVTLNRPEKHNALDRAMFEGIVEAAEPGGADAAGPRGRAARRRAELLLGLDVSAFGDARRTILERAARASAANLAQRTCTGWIDVPAPVIAAVHGNCFGGGLQIALGADIRFAAPDARLSVMESKWGLVPDMGITSTLPRLVPIDVAKELTFTGRVLSGDRGRRARPRDARCGRPAGGGQELAAEIAGALARRGARRQAALRHDAGTRRSTEGLLLETELQVGLIGSPNQIEAVRSGMAKEPANFVDPVPVA